MMIQDEADEMLSRGFKDQIYDVYRYLPPELQVTIGKLIVWAQMIVIPFFLSSVFYLVRKLHLYFQNISNLPPTSV